MAEQRLGRRLAPAERLEHLRGRRAAAAREDRVAEPLAELADGTVVINMRSGKPGSAPRRATHGGQSCLLKVRFGCFFVKKPGFSRNF